MAMKPPVLADPPNSNWHFPIDSTKSLLRSPPISRETTARSDPKSTCDEGANRLVARRGLGRLVLPAAAVDLQNDEVTDEILEAWDVIWERNAARAGLRVSYS
jgi:hypothetical protein